MRAIDGLHLLVRNTTQATSLDDERAIVVSQAGINTAWSVSKTAHLAVDAVRWLEQAVAERSTTWQSPKPRWKKVVEAEAKRLAPQASHDRIDLAIHQHRGCVALRRLTWKMPLDKLDQRLLESWDEALLADAGGLGGLSTTRR